MVSRSRLQKLFRAVCLAASIFPAAAAAAAPPGTDPTREDALRVFLDCNSCDFDYLRREIPFINYVRDRKDAELHILVTTQFTGSGGVEFTFRFIGLGRFEHVDDELKYTAAQTLTSDERRRGYAEVLDVLRGLRGL